ncbi:dipeptidylpeptidase [Actinomortierella ambigua]|uniref:Dipeptidylpeptidase n=1 Tax=Actinomortierella ambigua TaxID=1343610 RepID=A0A9P6PVZ8_9FUNG|nr:dipeptidylpeptidase [Actinomortierella ambigua]
MSTWDQIRSEVRSFRASIQPTVTTIRDFTFDSKRDRIYFLASDLAKSPKSPMLFYVDLPHVFAESDHDAELGTRATADSTLEGDDVEMEDNSDSDEGHMEVDEEEEEEGEEDEGEHEGDGDLDARIANGDRMIVPGIRRIGTTRSNHRPPPPQRAQQDGNNHNHNHNHSHNDNGNEDGDLDLVPFDPHTYPFVELTHPPRSLPSVVGSYPTDTIPAPIPASKASGQMGKDQPSPTMHATNDAAIEDILDAAPVLDWVPVLSEEWIKEHHAAYLLSRNDARHRQGDGNPPPRMAAGISQYQFDPQQNRILFPYGDEIYLADIPESGKIHPEPIVPRFYPGSSEAHRSPPSSSSLILQQPASPSVYFISGASPLHSPKSTARIPISTSVSSIASTAATSTSLEDHLEGARGSGSGSTASTTPTTGTATGGGGGGGTGACNAHVRMDPKLGGTDMNLIAFTRTRDLWVVTTSGVETQLTFCSRNKSNTAISCGIAEFIMQEEFHRYTNYYWAPPQQQQRQQQQQQQPSCFSSSASSTNGGATTASSSTSSVNSVGSRHHRHHDCHHQHHNHHHYHHNASLPVVTPRGMQTRPKERILYLQVSEAMVDVVMIPRQGIHPEVEEYRYPHAGTANAASDIQIVEFVPKQDEDDIVPEPLHKRLWGRSSIYKICPWLEYIVRFGWTPNGDSVWAQVLDRKQQTSALVMIPLDCFQSVTEHANSTQQIEEELASRIKIIFEERSDYWINVTDILYIFPSSDSCHSTIPSATTTTTAAPVSSTSSTSSTSSSPSSSSSSPPPPPPSNGCGETTTTIQCIVASERTGFRHLYLLTYDSTTSTSRSSIVPITAGDYKVVVDKPISVDLERRLVYFTAKRDTVLETHLYVASFARGADPYQHVKRLTHLGFSHQVTMDENASPPYGDHHHRRFLTLFSSIEQSPTCAVMHLRWDACKFKRRNFTRRRPPPPLHSPAAATTPHQQGQNNGWQENKRTRLAMNNNNSNSTANTTTTTTDDWDDEWEWWCDCGCRLPKISSYALLLREGIRNRSAKEVRDNPIVPPPLDRSATTGTPSSTTATSPSTTTTISSLSGTSHGRRVLGRLGSNQEGSRRMNGTATTSTTTVGLNPGGGGINNSNGTTTIRPRKSLSGFLASHLLSPGILQSSKFPGSGAFGSADSTLMVGSSFTSSSPSNTTTTTTTTTTRSSSSLASSSSSSFSSSSVSSSSLSSSLRVRTKSAPRLGVFSSSGASSSHSPSSFFSSSLSPSGMGGGGRSGGGGGGGGGGVPTSPPLSSSSSASGIGLAVNANHHPAGEFFTYESSDGVMLHGCLYRPASYEAGCKYPTLVSIYGGPKSQMVTNEYKLPKFLRVFLAARMGYAVVMFDGRGSNERGIEFEGRLRHRMGQVEIQDQVEGLRFLARPENGGVVDMDRVAITGWSYGGYLSLMALVQYPEVFKLAIAGAPVTQWELYNSAYTERYMGLLSENKEGYTKSNVLSWIDKFPDSENRLLIAHGLIDENVHFKNTETLSAELIRVNKPHHIQLYPTERHGLRDARVNEHFETLMFYWLRNYL